jgi:hypothetical protein
LADINIIIFHGKYCLWTSKPQQSRGERMSNHNHAPEPMMNWLSSLPSQNVGTLYAKIKAPILPIYTWHKVPVWGQVCDGRDHKDAVHLMLYNHFPNHGKGFIYTAWRAEPDNPEANQYSRSGDVEDPKPYSGIAYE